jgi:hypothetical protein
MNRVKAIVKAWILLIDNPAAHHRQN